MSHFIHITTKLKDRNCLVQALNDLKLTAQVHEKAQPLTGYYGQKEGNAEIIVPGRSIGTCADIGFMWDKDAGCYQVIHDPYETDDRLGENFFTHTLMQAYGKRVVYAKALELQQQFGECTITETSNGATLRLAFASHQHQSQQHVRR